MVEVTSSELEQFSKTEVFKEKNFTAVISTDLGFTGLKSVSSMCEKKKYDGGTQPKLIACKLYGNCGYIFNDFGRSFEVFDADGEEQQEVTFSSS